jgi:von Willebrand factor type A domain
MRNGRMIRVILIWLVAFASLAKGQTNFVIQDIHVNPDGSVTISWPAIPQIPYHVMFADSPTGVWQNFSDGKVTGDSNVFSLWYTDTNSLALTQRFYRIRKTRVPLIMALVLDRSGSMGCAPPCGSGGGVVLPSVVSSFIGHFDDSVDKVAMSSFGSTATLDVPMEQPFTSAITTAANAMQFYGRTFAEGGLQIGFNQVNSTFVPLGESVAKVIVFFTDGYANTFQTNFSCRVAPINLGQDDPPIGGSTSCCGLWDTEFMDPAGGSDPSCNSITFPSLDGTTKTISQNNQNVWNEGQLHALSVASQIRAANILIYSIGVGNGLNQDFLRNIANDPAGSTYNPSQVSGEAVFAPDASQLQTVFDMIATKVLYQ